MNVQETVKQLETEPIEYRIEVIELLLQSLKAELSTLPRAMSYTPAPFRVRTIDLGEDVMLDRDLLYFERGLGE